MDKHFYFSFRDEANEADNIGCRQLVQEKQNHKIPPAAAMSDNWLSDIITKWQQVLEE